MRPGLEALQDAIERLQQAAQLRHLSQEREQITPLSPASQCGLRCDFRVCENRLAAEYLVRDYAHAYGLGAVALRYFNASGADEDGAHGECRPSESHIIPRLLAVAAKPHGLAERFCCLVLHYFGCAAAACPMTRQ
jgi:hypothetical protein